MALESYHRWDHRADIDGVRGRPPIVGRQQWGARIPRQVVRLQPDAVVDTFVHYTASFADERADHAECAARVRGVQAYHMDSRGWADIGYSWLVCRHGYVFRGRGWGVVGAHTMGHNATSHAVCFLGGDKDGRSDVTAEALHAIGWLIREAQRRYPHARRVRPHSAVYPTACPGNELRAWITAGRWRR